MFVIVDLSDERKRRFEKYRKHIIETRRCDVFGSAPFFIAAGHGVYFDRAELENIIKRSGTALFRYGRIPAGFEKYSYSPSVLPLKMLVRTAALHFREAPVKSRNRTVSVFDRYAFAADEVEELSEYVRFVRVITDRPDVYYASQQRAYKACGAVITVGSERELAAKSDCAIALNDEQFDPLCVKAALVFSKNSACDNVFEAKNSSYTLKEFEEESAGIDRFLLLCALFETCGYKISEIPIFFDAKSILFKTFA